MKYLSCVTIFFLLINYIYSQKQIASNLNTLEGMEFEVDWDHFEGNAFEVDWDHFEGIAFEVDWTNFETETINTASYNWSFLTDQRNKALYIDFEALGGKMNRLVVTSDKNKIVIEDNHLFDLPFNTIYEIDLDKLKRGSYFVELYTHNHKIIRKEITIL